ENARSPPPRPPPPLPQLRDNAEPTDGAPDHGAPIGPTFRGAVGGRVRLNKTAWYIELRSGDCSQTQRYSGARPGVNCQWSFQWSSCGDPARWRKMNEESTATKEGPTM